MKRGRRKENSRLQACRRANGRSSRLRRISVVCQIFQEGCKKEIQGFRSGFGLGTETEFDSGVELFIEKESERREREEREREERESERARGGESIDGWKHSSSLARIDSLESRCNLSPRSAVRSVTSSKTLTNM